MDCVPLALPVLKWTPPSCSAGSTACSSQPDQQPEHWQSQWHTTINPFSTYVRESNARLDSRIPRRL
ncbi:MAG: hypothetical protein N2C14_29520 [Planctomycetales bacterium]